MYQQMVVIWFVSGSDVAWLKVDDSTAVPVDDRVAVHFAALGPSSEAFKCSLRQSCLCVCVFDLSLPSSTRKVTIRITCLVAVIVEFQGAVVMHPRYVLVYTRDFVGVCEGSTADVF